jgi:periplasmic protein TonB
MAYADQQGLSSNRIMAIVIVLLLHAFLGYALVTGLAFEAVKKAKERLNVVDVEEEKPPEEEPPPPEEQQVIPPVVSPPPIVRTVSPPPTVQTVSTPPPTITLPPRAAPPAPAAPPPPPPPPPPPAGPTEAAKPRGNPSNWATTNDYPSRALSQEREGTTGFRLTVGADGRVTSCSVTSSSGHADLDDATCKNVSRRAKFSPALRDGSPTEGAYSGRIRWQIPKE